MLDYAHLNILLVRNLPICIVKFVDIRPNITYLVKTLIHVCACVITCIYVSKKRETMLTHLKKILTS